MPDLFRQALGQISGGQVLDVATAQGGFVGILIDNLRGYTEVIGVDVDEQALQIARATFGQDNARFVQMDAEHLGFVDARFDTVNVSASLHHLENVPLVLAEMARVLKPGGHLIVTEMHSSGQSEAQLSTIYLHQWVAAVDAALGLGHYGTLARQDILDRVGALGLCDVAWYDFSDTGSDAMEPAPIERLEGLIDSTIVRARQTPGGTVLEQRGEELRRRLGRVGTQREPVLVVVGVKPDRLSQRVLSFESTDGGSP